MNIRSGTVPHGKKVPTIWRRFCGNIIPDDFSQVAQWQFVYCTICLLYLSDCIKVPCDLLFVMRSIYCAQWFVQWLQVTCANLQPRTVEMVEREIGKMNKRNSSVFGGNEVNCWRMEKIMWVGFCITVAILVTFLCVLALWPVAFPVTCDIFDVDEKNTGG
jgi:hypothetical protein